MRNPEGRIRNTVHLRDAETEAIAAAGQGGLTILRQYISVFALFCVIYGFTCAPDVLWGDCGRFQYDIWHNTIRGHYDLVLSHPLYMLLGIVVKHLSPGEFPHNVNLISAVSAALAVANVFLLLRLWFGRPYAGFIGALTLGLSWTTWQHACIAEVYSLQQAILTGELIVLFQYVKTRNSTYLYGLGFLNGLALANHMWAIIPAACYVAYFILQIFRRRVSLAEFCLAAVCWLAGAGLYLYFIVAETASTGSLSAALGSAIGAKYQHHLLDTLLNWKTALETIGFIVYNYPTPNLLFLFLGLAAIRRRNPRVVIARLLAILGLMFLVFACRYSVRDRFAFFIPFYVFASIFIGIGVGRFVEAYPSRIHKIIILLFCLLPVPTYFLAPGIARLKLDKLHPVREIPYRNDFTYFLQPWQLGYHGPRRLADDVFSTLDQNAVLYAEYEVRYSLKLVQEMQNARPDVDIIPDWYSHKTNIVLDETTADKILSERPVYVITPVGPYCPDFLLEHYDFHQKGIVWQVVKKGPD